MTDSERTYGQWWDTPGPRTDVLIAEFVEVCVAALTALGADEASALFLVEMALDKALQGDFPRGVPQILNTLAAARSGVIDLGADCEVLLERTGTSLVTGGPGALGDFVCLRAMDIAIGKARSAGVGAVSAQAACRIAAPYLRRAADAGMVSLMLLQSVPSVAPLGGREPLLGNAPIGIGIPTAGHLPFIMDASMTQSSNQGVLSALRHGMSLPEGVLLDEHGNMTTDAAEYLDAAASARVGEPVRRGTLAPIGNSHKGYALVLAVGILATLLADANPPWEMPLDLYRRGATSGTVIIVLDPAAFRGAESRSAGEEVDAFLDVVTSAPLREGATEILYPGRRSQELQQRRRSTGYVSVPAAHATSFAELADSIGMPVTLRPVQ